MSIQHKDIPDAQLHEPKGAASAATNSAYFATGAGSGAWKKVGTETLKGLTGDGGVSELKLITDGTNGFTLRRDAAYGVMGITNNGNNFAITAAVDPNLVTNSDYVLFTGTGAPWASEVAFGTTFTTDRITVQVAGVYVIRAWANVVGYPSNTAKIGAKFRINGSTFSPRTAMVKSTAVGDIGNLSAFGYATLAVNDFIQLYVASDTTGNLLVRDLNLTLELVRAT